MIANIGSGNGPYLNNAAAQRTDSTWTSSDTSSAVPPAYTTIAAGIPTSYPSTSPINELDAMAQEAQDQTECDLIEEEIFTALQVFEELKSVQQEVLQAVASQVAKNVLAARRKRLEKTTNTKEDPADGSISLKSVQEAIEKLKEQNMFSNPLDKHGATDFLPKDYKLPYKLPKDYYKDIIYKKTDATTTYSAMSGAALTSNTGGSIA